MYFRVVADATFEAENIDEAFVVLAYYFLGLALSEADDTTIFDSGTVEIKPVQIGE